MTWIVWGPKGCGKTHNRDAIVKYLRAEASVDDWDIESGKITPNAVHFLTSDRRPHGGKIPPGVAVLRFSVTPHISRAPAVGLPADWALKAAIIAGGPDDYDYDYDDLRIVKNPTGQNLLTQRLARSIIAHARLIEQTQPAPVDRKLLVAREAAARMYPDGRDDIERGGWDEDRHIKACLKFHELWESGYAA